MKKRSEELDKLNLKLLSDQLESEYISSDTKKTIVDDLLQKNMPIETLNVEMQELQGNSSFKQDGSSKGDELQLLHDV